MASNVWEWVADRYDGSYYVGSPKRNPTGPKLGNTKVVRGGGWGNSPTTDLRAANRLIVFPDGLYDFIGFRCAGAPGE